MLEIRPVCENCQKPLPPDSTVAMICTFECTFCRDCVEQILENVCPNCGGGFEKRPVRPSALMKKYPASQEIIHKPVDQDSLDQLKSRYKDIAPESR